MLESGTEEWLTSVWGSSSSDVYATGDNGTLLHYDGVAWKSTPGIGIDKQINKVWGSSSDNFFLLGGDGLILQAAGTR